jgi:hypothetical protein
VKFHVPAPPVGSSTVPRCPGSQKTVVTCADTQKQLATVKQILRTLFVFIK